MLAATRNRLAGRWFTPSPPPHKFISRVLYVPADLNFLGVLADLLSSPLDPEVWAVGESGISQTEAALLYSDFWEQWVMPTTMIGTIVPTIATTLPAHMLLCDGRILQRLDYPDLWNVIPQGLRIGSTQMRLPDLTDRFLRGSQDMDNPFDLGEEDGSKTFEIYEDNLPPHSHEVQPFTPTTIPHAHVYSYPSVGIDVEGAGVPDLTAVGNPPINLSTFSETVIVNTVSDAVTDEGKGLREPVEFAPENVRVRFAMIVF